MISDTKKEAILVFILLAITYAYFYHDPSWNGNSRLGLTFAIVQEGRLTIDSFHDQEGTITEDKAIYNNHYYTDKAIGSSLIAAIFYYPIYQLKHLAGHELMLAQIKYLLTFFSIGLPSAITGSFMYILSKQITANKLEAYAYTLAVCLGTMIFPFSSVFFGHQLAGSLLFSAFFFIFQLKVRMIRPLSGSLFIVGLLLGLALITEYPVAPIVMILTAYYLLTLFRIKGADPALTLIMPAIGALIPVALAITYSLIVFGNPIAIGYAHSAYPWFREEQSQGLVGIHWPSLKVIFLLALHPANGLLWQSPVLILSLIGIWFMSRKLDYRFEAMIALTAFLSLLVLYSGFYNWWGGWTFGPRYLIPMLCFMSMPLAFLPGRWFPGTIILAVISIFQMLIPISSRVLVPDDFRKIINKPGFSLYASIYDYGLPQLLDGKFAKNLGNLFLGLESWRSLLPLLLVVCIITIIFFRRQEYPRRFSSQA